MRYFVISIFFLLISCNGQKKASMQNAESNSKYATELRLLLQDEYGGFDVPETMVMTNAKELKLFYAKLNRTRKPGIPVPSVDFSNAMVIVQCSGQQDYSGVASLHFNSETADQLVFNCKIEKTPNTTSYAVTSNPFCVYQIPLTDKEIVVQLPE